MATSVGEAKGKVIAEYGEGHVITLHNEEEEDLKPTSHGRIYRILHYELGPQRPPSKRELPLGILAEVERDWRDFPNLPGKHMSWRKAGRGCWELITDSNGAVSVRREDRLLRTTVEPLPELQWLSSRPHTFTSQGRTYGWQRVGKRRIVAASRVADLLNTATNAPVLRITGVHYNGVDATSVRLADQREIRFPVRGHNKCALMSAIDDSGNSLVEYRNRDASPLAFPDAVINPNALTVPQIELLVAVSARLLWTYFQHPSGG